MAHHSVIESSKKRVDKNGTSQSFYLKKSEKDRADAIIKKHKLDRRDFYHNCVMNQVKAAEGIDKEAAEKEKE